MSNDDIFSVWDTPNTTQVRKSNSKKNNISNANKKNVYNTINTPLFNSPTYFLVFIVMGYFVVNLYESNRINGSIDDRMKSKQIDAFQYTDLLLIVALSLVTFILTNFKQSIGFYFGYFIGLMYLFVYSKEGNEYDVDECPPLDSETSFMRFDLYTFSALMFVLMLIAINFFKVSAIGDAYLTNQYLVVVIFVVLAFLTIIRRDYDRTNYILDWENNRKKHNLLFF